MGDLLFVLKMVVYTLVLVIILQVKVGPTTLEQKLHSFTHESQIAGTLQIVAEGAARFIGAQYNNFTGHLKSRFINQHSSSQRPGDRLQSKFKELKESINKHWDRIDTKADDEESEFIEEDSGQE